MNELYPLEECIGTPYVIAARAVAKGINEWKTKFCKSADNLRVFVEAGTTWETCKKPFAGTTSLSHKKFRRLIQRRSRAIFLGSVPRNP